MNCLLFHLLYNLYYNLKYIWTIKLNINNINNINSKFFKKSLINPRKCLIGFYKITISLV